MFRFSVLTPAALAAVLTLAVPAAWSAAPGDTPQPSKSVDLRRLAGRWYELARVPNQAEKDCPVATTDWAPKDGGKFEVTQTCRKSLDATGGRVIKATADPLDPVMNAKWRMNYFGGLIRRDYWFIDHANDDAWVILAMPGKKYLWVLTRHPDLPSGAREAVVQRVASLGYDASRLVFPLATAVRGG